MQFQISIFKNLFRNIEFYFVFERYLLFESLLRIYYHPKKIDYMCFLLFQKYLLASKRLTAICHR